MALASPLSSSGNHHHISHFRIIYYRSSFCAIWPERMVNNLFKLLLIYHVNECVSFVILQVISQVIDMHSFYLSTLRPFLTDKIQDTGAVRVHPGGIYFVLRLCDLEQVLTLTELKFPHL